MINPSQCKCYGFERFRDVDFENVENFLSVPLGLLTHVRTAKHNAPLSNPAMASMA